MFREICAICGKERESLYELKCKKCGGPFEIILDFEYNDKDKLANFPYIKNFISLGEGNTPTIRRGKNWFKLDFLNPTGSYKDRGSVTLISYLAEKGIKEIAEDSSGNAGSSIAAYSAAAGIKAHIYVPENAKGNKVKQIEAYGAELIKVKGSREDVTKAAESSGYYFASHVLQPQFRDGIRTLAYEIFSDIGRKAPDYVFLPVSAGTLLLGVHKGFSHLLNSGFIDEMPKIIAVQTTQVMPLCAKFKKINYNPPEKVTSIADALVSTKPFLLDQMIKAINECIVVSDEEIIEAWKDLAKMGILVEYSSATVYAAYKKFKAENSVLVLTGSGLKTI
ncbi:threonine synthase [Sulfolobus sp. A20]|uniref:pyridoxal-phosphate dependent enzyme n=2 Tax=Sulfolobaceae TaxID=118883 RepID=UPI0008461690|nr:pyridoxal-phosphate dependent enzyme [Sulfolobus sp. A20]TRM75614.1 threonine synthase [Sulfolobus sp. E5]TRM78546.1 threonine synthase [Sulfolobus sp. A20-N-F8]TRM79274.1 threonine synthase [Sulfolobus sp. B5]TRM82083.1 threonine synthase [Sulfolobus sp. D5]TRM82680.1 threonine synthase [Sulfolobus sp. A20-N-F6]TRM86909.1 threonine synthase [Sulfolobus sp. E3]TRM89822.1 threonine synthase [Sulfolobus sp. C3]TRM95340.1 threonine synthase [Sulfolobus sp. A20-N-G8]TRN03015.1 threonine syn